jgi:site-specific recombinase XerD
MTETRPAIFDPNRSPLSVCFPADGDLALAHRAREAWEEFYFAQLANERTRALYERAVRRFFRWADELNLSPQAITAAAVGRYLRSLPLSAPSKKLELAALRRFFDVLVEKRVLDHNPARSVRTGRYSQREGKTPEITVEAARTLIEAIPRQAMIDLRDRAAIGALCFTAARAGAVTKLRLDDLTHDGRQAVLAFAEKGGQARSIPVSEKLQALLDEYLLAGGLRLADSSGPLFRTIDPAGRLTDRWFTAGDLRRMLKRRLAAAALPSQFSPHSFRAGVATDLLQQGVAHEDVQRLLGHADARTTSLYDRRQRRVTRGIVERIGV